MHIADDCLYQWNTGCEKVRMYIGLYTYLYLYVYFYGYLCIYVYMYIYMVMLSSLYKEIVKELKKARGVKRAFQSSENASIQEELIYTGENC